MRLVFSPIVANSPEQAAAIARTLPTEDAASIDDCDGDTFTALVDVDGDDEHENTVLVDFEPERQRKAAAELAAVLRAIENDPEACTCASRSWYGSGHDTQCAIRLAREAADKATAS
jgi:hypothetical protein